MCVTVTYICRIFRSPFFALASAPARFSRLATKTHRFLTECHRVSSFFLSDSSQEDRNLPSV